MAEAQEDAGGGVGVVAGVGFVNVAAQHRLPNQRAILAAVAAFEKESDVKVIFASESSSRSIGTAHENSDHDIVAIYVHRRERYFSMRKMPTAVKKVFPEHGDVPEIEMVAWEARHAFTLLADSTLALLDAFYSPLIYCALDFEFSERLAKKGAKEDDDLQSEDTRGTCGGASAQTLSGSIGLGRQDAWSTGESSRGTLPTWVRTVQVREQQCNSSVVNCWHSLCRPTYCFVTCMCWQRQDMIWRLYSRLTLSWAAWGQVRVKLFWLYDQLMPSWS